MSLDTTIVEVTQDNLVDYPQVICFINAKHESHHLKMEWLGEQFQYGLKIKLLFLDGAKNPLGFIEYVPGEFCWRAVNARGYMFIHCLWNNRKKNREQGLGSLLIKEAEKDAVGFSGVAVMTSKKAFMAETGIFLKNDYKVVAESGKDQLLVKKFKDAPDPVINDWQYRLAGYNGLNMVYSKQCPWVARFIAEAGEILEENNLDAQIVELKTPAQAQHGPSMYAVFNLIYDGRLLSDRYISATRFKNILKKEELIQT